MNKYQSKAKQTLSAAMGPITAGLRRFEAEAQERAKAEAAPPEKNKCGFFGAIQVEAHGLQRKQKSLALWLRVEHLCSHKWALRSNEPQQRDIPGPRSLSHARVPTCSEW